MASMTEAWQDRQPDAGEGEAAQAVAACTDSEAFLQLYDRYFERIERYVMARMAGPEVEDVVSVIFMRALEKIHLFRPDRGTFGAWLFGIARNAVRDHFRRRGRFGFWALDSVETAPEPRSGPEDVALHGEQMEDVWRAFLTLTEDQREALVLYYIAELKYTEVARVMGKSDFATRKLAQRGLEGLRQQLSKEKPQ